LTQTTAQVSHAAANIISLAINHGHRRLISLRQQCVQDGNSCWTETELGHLACFRIFNDDHDMHTKSQENCTT